MLSLSSQGNYTRRNPVIEKKWEFDCFLYIVHKWLICIYICMNAILLTSRKVVFQRRDLSTMWALLSNPCRGHLMSTHLASPAHDLENLLNTICDQQSLQKKKKNNNKNKNLFTRVLYFLLSVKRDILLSSDVLLGSAWRFLLEKVDPWKRKSWVKTK